jgi:DNA modification methylase
MTTKWKYGDSWERFPIELGQTWCDETTGSKVTVCDLRNGIPDYMLKADMIYCDPPWNQANVNCFYTKAGITDNYVDRFDQFYDALFHCIGRIAPKCCYLEIGRQNKTVFIEELAKLFPVVQQWPITYYRKNLCYLLRGGHKRQHYDFAGIDDIKTPQLAVEVEPTQTVADLCTGQGLTPVAAFNNDKRFVGTELNKRRLAVAIDRVNKLGGKYEGPIS